jgi:SAM-dependent methyltransferase
MTNKPDTRSVRDYWEKHPAGYDEIEHLESDSLAFLEERDRLTRVLSPRIAEKYRMYLAHNADVLDIGCGQGYNAQELVRHGARLTAVDLTAKGIQLATQRFRLRNLRGEFALTDAQHMPFRDESFGFIHSSGVLHHIPDMEQAVDEVYRLLRTGGKASIMVYNRSSWQYWYKIQFTLRFTMVFLYLLPGGLKRVALRRKPGLSKYVPTRWPTTSDIVNAGTDFGGVENPLSRVFTKRGVSKLFHRFNVEGFVTSAPQYKPFKPEKNPWERVLAAAISWLNERYGWYLIVYLEK